VIDLHCHIDLYPNPHEVVASCVARRLYVLSVTTVPSAFAETAALAPSGSRIRTALGLHPELAAARAGELPLFERMLAQTRYVGEIGLDGSREHRTTLDAQRGVFADVLRLCARSGGKILSVHSRGATIQVLDILEKEPSAGTPILHWYIGSQKQIQRAAEMGCWFSVGPTMVTSERGIAAATAMPRDRILPESDGPFGILDGRPAYPWEAWNVATRIGDIWNEPCDAVKASLNANFRLLIGDSAAVTKWEPH
jgi:TatD DNase family protein